MHQLIGVSNPVLKHRTRSGRSAAGNSGTSSSLGEYERPRQNNQSSNESWHDKEFGAVWEMTQKDRNDALQAKS